MNVAIYCLLSGDQLELHRRLLDGLVAQTPGRRITVWLNRPGEATRQYVAGLPVHVARVDPDNTPKYPAMARLFAAPIAEEWVCWFDDDSYLQAVERQGEKQPFAWLNSVRNYLAEHPAAACLGQAVETASLPESFWAWPPTRPWHRGVSAPTPDRGGRRWLRFPHGAYWWLRTEVLRRLQWPDEALGWAGGQQALGEALRQHGREVHDLTRHVAVNAAPSRLLEPWRYPWDELR